MNSSHDPAPTRGQRSDGDRSDGRRTTGHRAGRSVVVGVAAALGAATLFAVNGTVSKLVLENGLSSLRLVEIRCVAAALAFAALATLRSPRSLAIGGRELGFLAWYGVLGIAMVQWLYLVAIARMPVGISLLLEFTAPLLVALYVRFVRREHVRNRIWFALAFAIGGLVLVAQVWQGLSLDAVGLVAALLAALSLALYYLVGEHGVGRRDPLSLAAWTFGAAGLFWSLLLPWWTFPFDAFANTADVQGVGVPVWALLVSVVLLGTVAPFGLVFFALGRVGAPRTGLLGTAEPVLAGIVAWVVLGEVLATAQLAGAAVVMAGILLAVTAREAAGGDDDPHRPHGTTHGTTGQTPELAAVEAAGAGSGSGAAGAAGPAGAPTGA